MKHKKPMVIISALILIIGICSYMLFSKNGYKEYTSGESFANLIDILLETSKGKDSLEINEESLNSIVSSYLNQGIKKDNITLKGFNANISKDKIKMLVPVKYKSLPFMLSTEGKIQLKDSKLIYVPEDFKVGKISISKEKVLSYLKKMNNNKLNIEDDKLIINANLFSKKVRITNIENGKFVGKINDSGKKMAGRIDKAVKKFESKDMEKKIEEKLNSKDSKSIESKINEKASSAKLNSKASNKSNNSSSRSDNSRSSLGAKESQMISIMNSTISKLDANISYNYWPDVEKVMEIYDSLPPKEKAKFKNQVFNYVDVAKAKEIKHRLGK
ncbi:hypothetical protein [Clostridium novyi]|uniref:hypothetical protein n=1 Tax=Clostridium novyi TaxID=1542 RepID=UPI0004D547A7|nr:hypothetical protein [Clostridium novyi]KEH84876.1 hypothetical protein Z967_10825 [Clostridium novyi A str. 4540]KEH90519.1 hypothetical protein Z964_11185 [Clostridium novyi A str. GD211209]